MENRDEIRAYKSHLLSTEQGSGSSDFHLHPDRYRLSLSLFRSSLFRFHVLGDFTLPYPIATLPTMTHCYTPSYDRNFFDLIKYASTRLSSMIVKEWYQLLVEKNITKREVDQEGRTELIPCMVEQRNPEVFWEESFRLSKLPGLSPKASLS